jgi:hypothetical protein
MSSTKETSGGRGWLCLLLILVVLAALATTKPSEAAHRNAIAQRTPILHTILRVGEKLYGSKLIYHDYFFCSITTAKLHKTEGEIPISIGIFGKVYYSNDK